MIVENYNPDVLSCLANLSNDEVFTPPTLVNDILDLLPNELWSNQEAKFLDPVAKSGVFLREIAKRLIKGLENEIPDQEERISHIFKNQIYGIAITELTSLISRRSVYCSKTANGKYSICDDFGDEQGNIKYERLNHTWQDEKCTFCGASKAAFDRDSGLESYAYNFIHIENTENIFDMKFDVIVGNPPYQFNTAGSDNAAQAKPLYHLFVQQAIKLNPRFLSMIIPSRWFSGGWGLDEFRSKMMNDSRMEVIHDFHNASECFPGVEIKGGVNYFLWNRDHNGLTKFFTHNEGSIVSVRERNLKLKNCDIIIRYNEAIPILEKVQSFKEESFSNLVSTKKPFGFLTNYRGKKNPFKDSVKLYANRRIEYVKREDISRRIDEVDKHKILVPKAVGSGNSKTDVIKPVYSEPNSCSTETYLLLGPFNSKNECDNVISYVETRFFHFLVTLQKNTQDCMKRVYSFVPIQDFSRKWSDQELYDKYGFSQEEISLIESMVHPEVS